MPSDAPPSYQAATGQPGQPGGPGRGPALNITTPQGETRTASQDALGDTGPARRPGHSRSASDVSDISDVESDGGISPGLLDEEGRRSMDDEQRELPEGWVRCWDPKNEHHFYVDTATKRSTWLHPYDDPEFLRTLPEHHPAHPNSAEATAMRKRGEDEALLVQKAQSHSSSGPGSSSSPPKGSSAKGASATNPDGSHAWPQHDEHRNWIQRKKDKLIGTKEERAKAKEDRRKAKAEAQRKRREMEEQYLKRRQELMRQQLNDPNIRNYYASDPFSYSAPAGPYSRAGGLYASPYGYGYPGGYGRRYGYGYGSPYGYGYGAGGLGMGGGMMLGGGAGLLGGMLLGDALAGGF